MKNKDAEKLITLVNGMLEDGTEKEDIINVLSPILQTKTDEEKQLEELAEKSQRRRAVSEMFNAGRKV